MPNTMRQKQILRTISSLVAGTGSRCMLRRRAIGQQRWSSSTNRHSQKQVPAFAAASIGYALAGSTIAAASISQFSSIAHAEAPAKEDSRLIRLKEVKEHGQDSDRKWIIKGTRVFDVTDWIDAHPGGPVILRGVGGSIDPYWDIFTIHKNQDVYDILEEYFIGDLDPQDLKDGKVGTDDIEDPFVNDPTRDRHLMQHTEKPCNSETPPQFLGTFITTNDKFYVRNHLWVPEVDEKNLTLTVELPDGTEKEYTISELKKNFSPFRMTATLQCSGNRRKDMSEGAKPSSGLQWDIGAISNAEWKGVRLRDVLRDAGFDINNEDMEDTKHVQFVGNEAYGASIPVEKALDRRGDVMLAYEMNGKPLPRDHGYPLRVLVPGHTAARSVKWLEKIILSEDESQSQWQQRDYKCFGPNQEAEDVDWSTAPAIQETPVQSAITSITQVSGGGSDSEKKLKKPGCDEDAVRVEGYAYSGGGREIIRVDLSEDGGRSWHQADLLSDESHGLKHWSWKRWQAMVKKPTSGTTYVVKAVDDSYNAQPESYDANWNFRGNLTNCWHQVDYPCKSDRSAG